ncbi:MAG: 16S rRNA (cytosine(967)-C(5))-methyltransferase RsmB [Candidatus Dadabacteria bacterium]|nr:16S rRNA (cytosine(967)-C(5))-methyltransferase RsmB [Candidatus Dadabacteria bacterium]
MTKTNNIRLISFDLLFRIMSKKSYPDLVINQYFLKNKHINEGEIKLITEIVYGTIRWKEKLRYCLNLFLSHEIKNKKVELVLLIGIYQILHLNSIPDYAAINETVELASIKFDKKIKNLVNALLRQISRNKENLDFPDQKTDTSRFMSVNYSYPKWLIDKWIDSYGTKVTKNMCISLNEHSRATIRVNQNLIERDKMLELISSDCKPEKTKYSNVGIHIDNQYKIINSNLYKDGYFSIQDESSQIVSLILDPKAGQTVLDACGAPGTKTNHIAELMKNKGTIICCDINNKRLRLVNNDTKRLGSTIVQTINADAKDLTFNCKIKFDKILVDAPCSGLGTIKKNPDLKWNKNMDDINNLSSIQIGILNNVSRLVKTGGIVVYSVCTLMKEENEQVCEEFLNTNKNFNIDNNLPMKYEKINRLLDRNGYFSSLKYLDHMDGFFIARFRKI